jgi:hypothetical protein
MFIKIIQGCYGYRGKDGNGSVNPKTTTDPPFEVSETEGKRLIELNVAVESELEKPPKPEKSTKPEKPPSGGKS